MIRSAEPSDYEAIATISNGLVLDASRLVDPEYVATVEEHGFLVPVGIPQPDFREHMPNYIVGEIDGRVSGFLRIEDVQEMDADEVPCWVNPEMEAVYWKSPHAGIGKIAVLPTMRGRGIGSDLLVEAERRSRAKGAHYLFSFIVTCLPPTNYSSISFHTKNGFQEVAPLEPQDAYGLSDYRATLYGKKLI